jgi:hypothetical protein
MEKNEKKLFTNSKSNNIMRKNSPLKANYEREGLFMKETKDVILEEIGEKLNFIERIFLKKKYIRIYNKARITTINKLLK